MKKTEENLQIAISNYLKLQYANVYFTSESSGLRVSIGTAVKMKKQRSKHKQLDLIILEPRGYYHGLIIELKKDESEVYKKNGEVKTSEHVKEQFESINLLNEKGYFSTFGFGFEDCKEIIDYYMSL
jgi:hypothetical protein